MKAATVLIFVAITLAYISCKKEKGSPASQPPPTQQQPKPPPPPPQPPPPQPIPIVGNWRFLGQNIYRSYFDAFTSNGNDYRIGNIIDVNTIENSGSMVITDSTIELIGLTYNVADSARQLEYTNGVATKDWMSYLVGWYGPSTGTFLYRRTGTDSLLFTDTEFFHTANGLAGPVTTVAIVELVGDTLKLTGRSDKDTSFISGGVPVLENEKRQTVLSFLKQ